MKQHFFAIAIASSLLALTGVQAMTRDEYKVAREVIERNYETAKGACDGLNYSERDGCMKQARGHYAVARAELEQLYKPSPDNARKVVTEKAKTGSAAMRG